LSSGSGLSRNGLTVGSPKRSVRRAAKRQATSETPLSARLAPACDSPDNYREKSQSPRVEDKTGVAKPNASGRDEEKEDLLSIPCYNIVESLFLAEYRVSVEAIMGGKVGLPELLVILVILFFLFGANKLPEIGKGIGEGIKNFKNAMKKEGKDE
jgi:sec-independent protein translocase protein TatA